jgi:hypothetical protein
MTNLIRATLLSVALSTLFASAAVAQVDKQDNEVAANGSLSASFRGGSPNLFLGAHYGKLLHDFSLFGKKIEGLQVGGDVLFFGSLDLNFGYINLFPAARLYFAPKDPRITPYAGVGLGLGMLFARGTTQANLAYDLNGGVKYFLNPTAAAFAQLDLTGPVTDPGSSQVILSAGLSVFF